MEEGRWRKDEGILVVGSMTKETHIQIPLMHVS